MINRRPDPIPPTVEEILATLRAKMPEGDEGVFCKADLVAILEVGESRANYLLRKWRSDRLIEPAGKVSRSNAWGDTRRVCAYRLVESEEER